MQIRCARDQSPRLLGVLVLRCHPCWACPLACRRAPLACRKTCRQRGRAVAERHCQPDPVRDPMTALWICDLSALVPPGLDRRW